MLGGGTNTSVFGLDRVPAFDVETRQWQWFDTLPDDSIAGEKSRRFPTPRKCHALVQKDNRKRVTLFYIASYDLTVLGKSSGLFHA
jgi:hypothetical protein